MSTVAMKWSLDRRTVQRSSTRKLEGDPAVHARARGQRVIGSADLARVLERGGAITPRRALARVEHALFALILGTVAYLWLAQAMAGF